MAASSRSSSSKPLESSSGSHSGMLTATIRLIEKSQRSLLLGSYVQPLISFAKYSPPNFSGIIPRKRLLSARSSLRTSHHCVRYWRGTKSIQRWFGNFRLGGSSHMFSPRRAFPGLTMG